MIALAELYRVEFLRNLGREHASQLLADFKVPQEILFVDDLPKSATGKVQRRTLKEMHAA